MLRERQKQARRQAILDAAEALIRETGATDFTMLAVAERAMVSPTTLYNLFGTKAAMRPSMSSSPILRSTNRSTCAAISFPGHSEGPPARCLETDSGALRVRL